MDNELKKYLLESGTTILGIVCKDGIVMGGDRQVTAGNIVMNKKFRKVHPINDYILVAWTGGVSDALMLSKLVKAELNLKEFRTKRRPTVKEAANLIAILTFRNIRQPSMIPSIVGTLIGGVNEDGTVELYTIEPAGGVYKVEDYDANFGSGMPYVLGFLERNYREDMSVDEGVKVALEAIKSSTQRDVGSGYGIDIFTITKEGIKKIIDQEILPTYTEEKKKTIEKKEK